MTARSPAEAGVHDAGGGRHARQAERDAERGDQGRQSPLCRGPARQHRRQQGQHRSADQGDCWRASSRTLNAAGFGWGDLVDGIVYITDLNNFPAMNTGYRSVISKDFPARATVKTGLVGADGLVEIMFVASK